MTTIQMNRPRCKTMHSPGTCDVCEPDNAEVGYNRDGNDDPIAVDIHGGEL